MNNIMNTITKKNDPTIIAIDHGFGNIKTAHSCYRTGVTSYDKMPTFTHDMLTYNGKYYIIGEEHKEFVPDKMSDSDYYILTLAAIARELHFQHRTSARVFMAVGLPLTWVGEQREDFKAYLLQNETADFNYKGTDYHEVDLVDIADYWFDPRIALLLAPSKESYDYSVARVADPQKVVQVGFPVRRRFIETPPKPHEGTAVTVMSGAEGSGIVPSVARVLLKYTDYRVNVICGRNKKLRKRLKRELARRWRGRVKIMGFVAEIEEVMAFGDVLVMRASPNSVMEAVAMRVPVVMFGQLAGQERHNPDLLEAHGVAKYCPEPFMLSKTINELLADGGAQAEAMRQAQRAYAPEDTAARTAALLREWVNTKEGS